VMLDTNTHQSIGHPAVNFNAFCRDERFAASYLGVTINTLRAWRNLGRGPRFRKFGRSVRYTMSDLEAFIASAPSGGGVFHHSAQGAA